MKDNPVFIYTAKGTDIVPDKKMALRFMGCQGCEDFAPDLYEECLEEFMASAVYKAVYRKTGVEFFGEKGIRFDFMELESESLRKNLSGCKSAFIFAATAGAGVDRLVLRYSKLSPAKALVLDCLASAGIEAFCDSLNDMLKEKRSLRPRYSPGYGDVSVCCQSEILSFVDAYRKAGLTLTETYLMTPIKSVTAIIGVEEEK